MVAFRTVFLAIGAVAALGSAKAATLVGNDILNFALQLECLEAEYYSYAVYGTGLTDSQRGGGPVPLGGQKAELTGDYAKIAKEIADDEIAHVDLLRGALGSAAVACPQVDIGPAFVAAANAAFGTTLSPEFSPYANDITFLLGAFIFEDVGVTAYKGAVAPLADLVSGDILTAAAGLLAVEAYHAGIIRDQLYTLTQVSPAITAYNTNLADIVLAISNLRDAVDGSSDMDQGLMATDGSTTLVPTDSNGLVYSRSIAEIMAIVYLGSADTPGGFFPNGLNGVDYLTVQAAPSHASGLVCGFWLAASLAIASVLMQLAF